MQIDPSVFRRLDLRVHSFLDDVPIQDVWRIELSPKEGDVDIQDVRTLFSDELVRSVNPFVRALFALRKFLGVLFGWDRAPSGAPEDSYVHRLTHDDLSRSLAEPGTPEGPFRVLYVFPNEVLAEVINRTVHAFSSMVLVPHGRGYMLYWAIYVRPGSLLSRFYMALIRPFRHWIVYPSILARAQRAWEQG